MKKNLIKTFIVITFLILIVSFAAITDIGEYEIKENEYETQNQINWNNPFGFELSLGNIFWLIIAMAFSIVLCAFIVIGIIKWRWVLIILGVLLFCVILLAISPDPEPVAMYGGGLSGEQSPPSFLLYHKTAESDPSFSFLYQRIKLYVFIFLFFRLKYYTVIIT